MAVKILPYFSGYQKDKSWNIFRLAKRPPKVCMTKQGKFFKADYQVMKLWKFLGKIFVKNFMKICSKWQKMGPKVHTRRLCQKNTRAKLMCNIDFARVKIGTRAQHVRRKACFFISGGFFALGGKAVKCLTNFAVTKFALKFGRQRLWEVNCLVVVQLFCRKMVNFDFNQKISQAKFSDRPGKNWKKFALLVLSADK